MHSNTEGNSPSLRPQLGVGFGRPLPAPFGFDKAFNPDGVNDYFKCLGGSLISPYTFSGNSTITIEFWMKIVTTGDGYRCLFEFEDTTNTRNCGFAWQFATNTGIMVTNQYTSDANFIADTEFVTPTGNPIYVVITYDKTTKASSMWVNNVRFYAVVHAVMIQQINAFSIAARTNNSQVTNGSLKIDEMRIYKGNIGADERLSNYNLGIGNNPAKSENLIAWWDFNAAELDTALFPGGIPVGWTAGAYGVRDKAGNSNHLMQVNMANNATLGGALTNW